MGLKAPGLNQIIIEVSGVMVFPVIVEVDRQIESRIVVVVVVVLVIEIEFKFFFPIEILNLFFFSRLNF